MDHNFKCKDCKKTFFVSTYKYGFVDGELVLIGQYQCYRCKSYNTEELPTPKRNYSKGIPGLGKFSSASDEEKKRILQKRADEHYQKYGKEEKRERFKNAMNKLRK